MPAAELEAVGPHAPGSRIAVPARWLLTPYRFDIPAKYLYARHRAKDVASAFARTLYEAHLKVWNGVREIEPVKEGVAAYLDSFHDILESTRKEGFDAAKSLIPVGRALSPINGGHRIAACLLHGQALSCEVRDEGLPTHNYNYLYFRNREAHVPGGLAPHFQDAIALEYCRLKPHTYAALVFPSAPGRREDILRILLSHGHLVYEKDVVLGERGRFNFIRRVYAGEAWLGTAANRYAGNNAKAALCFTQEGPLRLFLFEAHDPASAVKAKSEIRDLFGIGKHSMHINDSHEETLRVAEALLNENSLHHLEHAAPIVPPRLLAYLESLRAWLRSSGLPEEDVCIGGSAVLAAYGLRDGKDLDFVHHFPLPASALPEGLGSHNEYASLYGMPVDDLIYDPANHFHFAGFKFVALPVIARMKETRGERKDVADLRLIREVL